MHTRALALSSQMPPVGSRKTCSCSLCLQLWSLSSHTLDHSDSQKVQKQLVYEINRTHSSIIDKLPVELLSEIFRLVVDGSSSTFSPRPYPQDAIGAVCQLWRAVAWSTSSLWTHVEISAVELHLHPVHIQGITARIERAGRTLPLALSVKVYSITDSSNFQALVDLINLFADRWHTIDVTLPLRYMCILGEQLYAMPRLESVALNAHSGEREWPRHLYDTFKLTNSAPANLSLNMKDIYLHQLDIQFRNLTVVELSGIFIDECVEVIRRAPLLNVCDLRDIRDGDDPLRDAVEMPLAPIVHNNLRTLKYSYVGCDWNSDDDGDADLFFNSITLPSLIHLEYGESGIELFERDPGDILVQFLERSKCQIKSFVITDTVMEEDIFVEVLCNMPCLETLKLNMRDSTDTCYFTDGFIEHLAEGLAIFELEESGIGEPDLHKSFDLVYQFLPNLRTLEYWGSLGSDFTDWMGIIQSFRPSEVSIEEHWQAETAQTSTYDLPVDSEPGALQRPLQSVTLYIPGDSDLRIPQDFHDSRLSLYSQGKHVSVFGF